MGELALLEGRIPCMPPLENNHVQGGLL
jgi:hypothetical protein